MEKIVITISTIFNSYIKEWKWQKLVFIRHRCTIPVLHRECQAVWSVGQLLEAVAQTCDEQVRQTRAVDR